MHLLPPLGSELLLNRFSSPSARHLLHGAVSLDRGGGSFSGAQRTFPTSHGPTELTPAYTVYFLSIQCLLPSHLKCGLTHLPSRETERMEKHF